jgi:hypothetical protein
MKKSKILALITLGILIGSSTANANNGAISYSYLSGGAVYDKSGWNKKLAEFFKQGIGAVGNGVTQEALTPKRSSLGGYLHGSYAVDDNIFLETKLRYLGGRKNGYFVGVGYHLAVADNADFYMTAGISQPDLPASVRLNQKGGGLVNNYPRSLLLKFFRMKISDFTEYMESDNITSEDLILKKLVLDADSKEYLFSPSNENIGNDETIGNLCEKNSSSGKAVFFNTAVEAIKSKLPLQATIDNSEISLKSKLAPAVEVGYRIHFTEQLGARLAYRGRYDLVRISGKLFNPSTQRFTSVEDKKHRLTHEGTVEATYAFNPNLTAEIGHTMSKMSKIGPIKPKMSHYCTAGLRYNF